MRAAAGAIVVWAVAASGCGAGGSLSPEPPRPPETVSEQAAADVVRAYDRAIRQREPESVCRIVGGAELEEFSCRTVPTIPDDRETVLSDPSRLGVHRDESRRGSIVLSGDAVGTDMGLHLTVRHARGGLRVTGVRLGYTF